MSANEEILTAIDKLEKASAANTRAMNATADAINASIAAVKEAQAMEKEIIRDLAGTIRQWANVMKPDDAGNSVTSADEEVSQTKNAVATYELTRDDIAGFTKHVIDITFEKIRNQMLTDEMNRYNKRLLAINNTFDELRKNEDNNLFTQAMSDFYEEDKDDE